MGRPRRSTRGEPASPHPPCRSYARPGPKNHVLRCKWRVICGANAAWPAESFWPAPPTPMHKADAMLHATFRNEQTSFFLFHSFTCTCTCTCTGTFSNLSWVHSLTVWRRGGKPVPHEPSFQLDATFACGIRPVAQSATGSDHLTSDIPRAGRFQFQAHERPAHRSRKTNLCVDCCGTCSSVVTAHRHGSVRHGHGWARQLLCSRRVAVGPWNSHVWLLWCRNALSTNQA